MATCGRNYTPTWSIFANDTPKNSYLFGTVRSDLAKKTSAFGTGGAAFEKTNEKNDVEFT